jgi:MFS family permease
MRGAAHIASFVWVNHAYVLWCNTLRSVQFAGAAMTDTAKIVYTWRTPAVIIIAGCLIAMMSFGPRSSLGFFLTPISSTNHWGRDVFGFALALQNLLWGIGQPLAGIIADRYGTGRVLCTGAAMYALGLALMAHANSAPVLDVSAGVLIGFGLSGSSFMVLLAAFGKLLPMQWRSRAYGFGTAAGSFGQFLYSPLAVALMDSFGWQETLTIFAVSMLAVLPLSMALATPAAAASKEIAPQSLRHALGEAFAHRSYILLVIVFFT